ncbi:hypothetical protein I4U23_009021 [Adineta vaga]|nr:hypothetical protein I4U23_009021 [Adineta vaga]
MTSTYADYTLRVENIGWPWNPYITKLNTDPILQYAGNFRNESYSYQYSQQESEPEYIRRLAIRRHEPGSTDPPIPKLPMPVVFVTPMLEPSIPPFLSEYILQPNLQSKPSEPVLQPTVQSTTFKPIPQSKPVQKQLPVNSILIDPNDRPIRPMKDTSVYNNPSSSAKPLPPLKRIHSASSRQTGPFQLQPKPVQTSSENRSNRLESASKPVQSPSRNQLSRLQSASKLISSSPIVQKSDLLPPSPSRTQLRNVSARRPIQTNIRTIFDNDLPPQHNQRRPISMHEYDHRPPLTHIRSAPKRIVSHQEVPLIITDEISNQRIIRSRPSLSETIIYRT